jgi:cell volume regulation protein A
VAIASAPWRFTPREIVVLGWAGLRGAVPVVLATFAVISEIPDAQEFFNVIFFAVAISTLLQGATFEPLAERFGMTTNEPALPRPLTEAGTIRRLGAEVVEYEIAPDDAIVGARVRDLGLPREANVTVLVRGDQAIPPRGATRLRAGDRLHLLLRQEASAQIPALLRRWRAGPIGPPPRPPRRPLGRPVVFTVRPWDDADGDAARVEALFNEPVVDQLRVRRDVPGGLWVLADGRYAVTGPLLAAGGRGDVTAWARRRLRQAEPDERAWLQTVIGALASDFPE